VGSGVRFMCCAWCGDRIREDDAARRLPGTLYHAACWEYRCIVVGESGPALVVQPQPLRACTALAGATRLGL